MSSNNNPFYLIFIYNEKLYMKIFLLGGWVYVYKANNCFIISRLSYLLTWSNG